MKARNLLAASMRHWQLAAAWRNVCVQAYSLAGLFHHLQILARAFFAWCVHTSEVQRLCANEHNVLAALRAASENVAGQGNLHRRAPELVRPSFRAPWCVYLC